MRNFAINNFQKLSDLVTHTGSDLRRNSPWRRWRKKFILDVKGLQNNLVTGLVPNWRRQFFLNQLLDTKFLFLLQKNVRLFILFESISEYQHLPQMTFIRRSFLTNYFALSSSFFFFWSSTTIVSTSTSSFGRTWHYTSPLSFKMSKTTYRKKISKTKLSTSIREMYYW